MRRHRTHRIAAPALAAACGISEAYLRRLFVRCLGVPPTVYMLQRRLQHAYELITSQEFSVTTAAAAGFCDMSYFSRAFKKHFGIAPAALRRENNRMYNFGRILQIEKDICYMYVELYRYSLKMS